MIQFGMRVHDVCPKGEMQSVLDNTAALGVRHIQLAMGKSFSDVNTTPGHYSAGLAWRIRQELEQRRLHTAVLGCYINPAHPEEESRLLEVKKFIEHLRYARILGADMVGTETGRFSASMQVTEETRTEKCYQLVLDSFRRIREAAERLGVVVGVEGVFNHTLHSPEMMQRFLEEIDSPNFEVIMDPVNMISPERVSPEQQRSVIQQCFSLYGDRITVLHLKDFCFEGELHKYQPVGEGCFCFPAIMEEIRAWKPEIIGILENSSPERYHRDCSFLQEQFLQKD